MKSYFIIISLILLLSISSVSAIICNPNLPNGCPKVTTKTSTSFNNNTANVNNSQYLQGYTPFNLPYLVSESDPVFTSWLGTNPLANFINSYNNICMLNVTNQNLTLNSIIINNTDNSINSLTAYGNNANYFQTNIKNINASGSSDMVATASNGNEESNYTDCGMNGPLYNSTYYNITGPNDGYCYVQGRNFLLGTGMPNTNLLIFIGGFNRANLKVNISNGGITLMNGGNLTTYDNNVTGTQYVKENIIGNHLSSNITVHDANVNGTLRIKENIVGTTGTNLTVHDANFTGKVNVVENLTFSSGACITSNATYKFMIKGTC